MVQPYVQRRRGDTIYFDIPLRERVVASTGFTEADLVHVFIRNQDGKAVDVKRKVSGASDGRLKFYLPREETEELDLEEGDTLELFLTSAE